MTAHSDPFEDLPGGLMIWVLIASEMLVFGAGLAAFLAMRITDPAGFLAAQAALHPGRAGVNTCVLVTSGLAAALAARAGLEARRAQARCWLAAAAGLGVVFLAIKSSEFADLVAQGISTETHVFFTFYYLLTGFHAAHVVAGIVLLAALGLRCRAEAVEAGCAFWHMVDLVWVLLFPVLYLLP